MSPFFTVVHIQRPYYFKLEGKISIFPRFARISKHFGKSPPDRPNGKFSHKFDHIYTEWPLFWEIYIKKGLILGSHNQRPLFSMKSYTKCSLFSFSNTSRHIPTTFIGVKGYFKKYRSLWDSPKVMLLTRLFFIVYRGGQPTACEQFLCGPPHLQRKKIQWGTPIYVGRNNLPVDRPLDSLFWHKSYTKWPHFSLQSKSKDSFLVKIGM